MKALKVNWDELYLTDDDILLWQEKPFTGISVENIRGTLIGEDGYVNGLKHGLSKQWYPSGALKSERHYINGTPNGTREWFENGNLKLERIFEFGFYVSEKVWDIDGNLTETYQISEKHPYYNRIMKRLRENYKKPR
jgi:antitoxin component YwqK of YwqJK toxin-antitoxin module